ncbi:hypothetical protein [Roseimaritima sediminicola]|uniref:hypothetical protein n=1 Tax=Roseimaritima sediminicola TaxID=2662066 RepID=UPI0012982F00|nr:hypothetical protein [Roseimaritima sediminicola]
MSWCDRSMRRALSGLLIGGVLSLVSVAAQAPSSPEPSLQSSEPPPESSSPFDDLLEGLPTEPQPAPEARSAGQQPGDAQDGGPRPGGEADALGAAYQAMQQAGRRLQRREEVPAAIDAQQQAIDALDALLEQLQQPSNQPEGGEAGEQASAAEQQPSEEAAEESSPADSPSSPEAGDSDAGDSEGGDSEAGDSEEGGADPAAGDGGQTNEAGNRSADLDPAVLQRALQEGVWGHLPERVRQQLQAARPEEFHPRYRDAIIDYFRQLAQ